MRDWSKMGHEVAGRASEIPPGAKKVVTLRGREIVIFNIGGEFFAFLNRCPHEGAKLCHGLLVGLANSDNPGNYNYIRQGEMLQCPWHGWMFDIRTGQSWFDPMRTKVRSFPITVEKATEPHILPGPYKAETFPVTEEDQYVFVDI
jgi:nitrite reductase/ring-hydroxylating ferredoxin subunit